MNSDQEFQVSLPTIEYIYRFVDKTNRIFNRSTGRIICVCVHEGRKDLLCAAAVAMGAFMILALDKTLEEVFEAFKSIRECMDQNSSEPLFQNIVQPTVEDCWRALLKAKNLGWIDQSRRLNSKSTIQHGSLDIDQFEHYSRSWNGGLHTIIPGKLIIFPDPEEFEDGQLWLDTSDGTRSFSPTFYADLFQELNVSIVVCLGKSDFDFSAFLEHDEEYDELGLESGNEPIHILRAMDRLLTLARAAPGALALHGGGAHRLLAAFVAACLSSCNGFEGGAAVAWISMTCPSLVDCSKGCHDAADLLRRHQLGQAARTIAAGAGNEDGFERSTSAQQSAQAKTVGAASPAAAGEEAQQEGLAKLFLLRTCSAPGT